MVTAITNPYCSRAFSFDFFFGVALVLFPLDVEGLGSVKFHYAILVADRFEPASNLSATSFEPASKQLASWIA